MASLANASFDLIVSDIEMPVMDGLAFARRIRDDRASPACRFWP